MSQSSSGKVWFITGTSKGFGRVWAEAALERGDRVAATARDVATALRGDLLGTRPRILRRLGQHLDFVSPALV